MRHASLAIALILSVLPGLTPTVVAAAAPQTVAHAKAAQRLVDLLYPVAIDPVQYDNLERAIRQQYGGSAEFADLEKAYPGITDAVVVAIMPHLKLNAQAARTGQRADMKQFYLARLTAAELTSLADFWSSAIGLKFIAGLNQNLRYRQSVADAASDKGSTSQNSVRSDLGSAGVAAATALTPAERMRIMAFMASPAGRKQTAIAPDKVALDTKWFNMTPPPERQRAVQDTVTKTMLDFITRAEAVKNAKKGD